MKKEVPEKRIEKYQKYLDQENEVEHDRLFANKILLSANCIDISLSLFLILSKK